MADEKPTLQIDDDWKRQAQEEKRKLAEAEQQRKAEEERRRSAATTPSAPPGMGIPPDAAPTGAAAASMAGRARGERGMPQASFMMLVQSILTQALFYLGDLAPRGTEPQINLDLAKNQVDLLGVLDEKTKGNLTDDERKFLDNTLYEIRMRYVAIASQYATV